MQKAIRVVGLIAIVAAIFAAMFLSLNAKPSIADKVWDKDMTVGDLNANNYFIIYSDLVCPYCVAFENAIVEHEDEFERYIAENNILVEIRLSDFLYEYGESKPISSRLSAEGVYCAKREGRFWDYYHLAITEVWNGYFKELGKSGFSKLNLLNKEYWIELGKQIGLGDSFISCIENDEALDEIKANALKSAKSIDGMPYFKFNNFTNSGFDLSWGWEHVQMYFAAGLRDK